MALGMGAAAQGRPARRATRLLAAGAALIVSAASAAAETWDQRLRALEAGQAPRFDVFPLQTAQAPQVLAFDIRPQALIPALIAFTERTGIQLFFNSELARGLESPGVSGSMTAEEALRRLLGGTGLAHRFTDANTVTLVKIAAGDVQQLAPLRVEADKPGDSAFGPVPGYVATNSATATKTDTPIIEVPQSVSVVTRDQMDDRNVQSLADSLRYSAGVQAGDTNDPTTESFSIRGYNSPYLSLYRDGTRVMLKAFDNVVEPYGLERVEVLRGPASVLYGEGVPGGVVNIVSKRPTDKNIAEGQLEVGTRDRYQAAFDIGGAISDDNSLQVRLTALGRKSDTQTDFVPDDRVFIAPGLRWRSDHGTDVTLFAEFQQDWTSFPDGLPANGTVLSNPNGSIPTRRFVGEPGWSDFERTTAAVGYVLDQELTDVFSFHQNLRYSFSSYDRNQVQNRDFNDATLRSIDRRARAASQESSRINVDTRLQAEFGWEDIRNQVIAGFDFTHGRFKTEMWQGNIDPLDLFDPDYGADVETPDPVFDDRETVTHKGAYLQAQTKLFDSLILVGGVRHDWSEDKIEDKLTPVTLQQKDDATTYRVGGVYLAPYGLAPYASYTTSFVPVFGTDAQDRPFKPETGDQVEVGLKFAPKDFRGSATVSAFRIVRQNVQTPDPNDPDFLVQTGEVTTRGLELEAVAGVTKALNVTANVSLLDAEVTKSEDVDLGKRPTTVPETMASLWADYAFDQGPLEGLSFGAGFRYVGNTPGDAANTFFVPDYALFDAALRYQWQSLNLALNVSNIADKEYVSTCFALSSCYYGQRRTVIGTLTYRW
jgi:iron complex outermembrane receptor protein